MKTILAMVVLGSAALVTAFGAGCSASDRTEQTSGSAAAETVNAETSCSEEAIHACMEASAECNEGDDKGEPTEADVRDCCIYTLEHFSTKCGPKKPVEDR